MLIAEMYFFGQQNQKRMVLFSRRQCRAYLNSGRIEEYFTKLESDLDSANSEQEMKEYLKNFPKGSLLPVLQQCPDLLPRSNKIIIREF